MPIISIPNKKFLSLALTLVTTFIPLVFVFSPFFHDGFFPTMDDVQVVRIEEMYKELASGQFPVRLVSDLANGSGYMLYNYYSPLVYYIGAVFHFLGATLIISTKLTFLTGFMIAWLGIVFLLKEKFDSISTFFGSILFFASSYMGYDAFHRGSLAEFFAMALLPFIFYSILKLSKNSSSSIYFLTTSFSIALLIITHNLISLLSLPFIFTFLLVLLRKNYKTALNTFILGLLLSAFFWIPVVLEKDYIVINQVNFIINTYKTHFLSLPQLMGLEKIPWGFVPPLLGTSLVIGSLLGAILILLSFKSKFLKIKPDIFIIFSVISFFITLFMASNLSQIVWQLLAPILKFTQFPWRFLTLTTFFGSISCAFLLHQFKNLPVKIIIGIILVVPIFTVQYTYLRPLEYNFISKYTADDPCATAGWSDEYLPIWPKKCHLKGEEFMSIDIISGNIKIQNLEISNHSRIYNFKTSGEGTVVFDKYYFPGWQIKVDSTTYQPKISSPHGFIAVTIPSGEHSVALFYNNTTTETVSNFISLASLIFSFYLLFMVLRSKSKVKQH